MKARKDSKAFFVDEKFEATEMAYTGEGLTAMYNATSRGVMFWHFERTSPFILKSHICTHAHTHTWLANPLWPTDVGFLIYYRTI